MNDKYILENFREEVQRNIKRYNRIRNFFYGVFVFILLLGFVYMVYNKVSIAKYFFS